MPKRNEKGAQTADWPATNVSRGPGGKDNGRRSTQRFDPVVSLIIYGLQQEKNENILEKIDIMFSEGLGSEILAKDAERMTRRGDGQVW